MSIKVERGLSCRNDGDVNFELTAPSYQLLTYTGESVLGIWVTVEPMLRLAAVWSRGEFSTEDALSLLLARRMILWVFHVEGKIHLAVLTEVRDYPRKRVCNIYAAAGKNLLEVWTQALPLVKGWLTENHIEEIEATCRDAVMRKLLRVGFRKQANVLRFNWKELL